ncbi:PREDICTED: uncharacterized protein LOC104812485 [Tarenaya hassleriana]|uniref:uncharacterized protein LOC104812485 n=1 Tax=Tarenaya hassleriana TaxID=28532 RepID=UPI00053C5F52|nr:PREDICTED: uncharacterized protein LOC104812485 [Tarenaya hassleriana]
MAGHLYFPERHMAVDKRLGYPITYKNMCREREIGPYGNGPPSTFLPHSPQETESLKTSELEEMFPVINPKVKPTTDPRIFLDVLWKELDHLGNAGFDPAVIRVDPYGNVLYFNADSASPLAWDIDHWFPLSRGGLTVPSNLRLLQRQVYKKKHNKLEFLIPWWDLQLGISVTQFLSIFASSNSDFRRRGFYYLFKGGEEEVTNTVTVESLGNSQRHPPETSFKPSLAPTAIVRSERDSHDDALALRTLNSYQKTRPPTPAIASRKIEVKPRTMKENEAPDFTTNPYQAIVAARNSLKQQEGSQTLKAEIKKLDGQLNEMRKQNDEEQLTIEELEFELIQRRRNAEKCRRVAEEQCSYRNAIEKMIRDAMHQSVVYKEQVSLNHAATMVLKTRLDAQKAMCDESEKELHTKSKKRDELEKQLRLELQQARKRSRLDDSVSEKKLQAIPQNHNPREELDDGTGNENRETMNEEIFGIEDGLRGKDTAREVKNIESRKSFRRVSSSPWLISGMKTSRNCNGKDPARMGDDRDHNLHSG